MPVLKIKQADGTWQEVWGALGGGSARSTNTDVLVDENNNEFIGVVVDEFTMFDATPDDLKAGKVAASDSGVIIGTHDCD